MKEIIIIIVSILSIVGSLLPTSKSKHWFVRGQSNFRAVYFFLNVIMIYFLSVSNVNIVAKLILGIMLAISIFVCLRSIAPFSPLYPKKIKDANDFKEEQKLSILIHNVYQYNNQYHELTSLIKKQNPDMVLLLETNQEWYEGLSKIIPEYPYFVKSIQENTYGIMLVSKIKLEESDVNFLVSGEIPSIEALITKCNNKIRIIGLHPEPPIPGEVLSSLPKEKEMISAAEMIDNHSDEELTIVIGDLNDVAWSKVAMKFKRLTGLVDPRIGRGFYATFPTYSPVKIPLDHVFCSKEFELINFDTLDAVGSDHRPVLVEFKVPNSNNGSLG